MNFKYLAFAVMAGAALVGCTKTEMEQGSSDVLIKFSNPVNTKAETPKSNEVLGANYDEKGVFAVWAVSHEKNYTATSIDDLKMYMGTNKGAGVECEFSKTDNCWNPVNDYYWPKQNKLSFQAVSPAKAEGVTYAPEYTIGQGISVSDFSASTDLKKQFDLMYSDLSTDWTFNMFTAGDNDDNTTYIYKGVDLLFHHALSAVHFTFKTNRDYKTEGTTITVTSVTIKNVRNLGDFSASAANPSVPTWSLKEGVETFTIYSDPTSGWELSNSATEKDYSSLLVIPQDLADDLVLEISYILKNPSQQTISEVATIQLNTAKKNNTTEVINKWEIGHRYTYNLNFNLQKIYFDPASVDWIDVNAAIDIIPGTANVAE